MMLRYAFIAVSFFALGVLLRDSAAQPLRVVYIPHETAQCQVDRANAQHYAQVLSKVLSYGDDFRVDGAFVTCRVRHFPEDV
jgi:hypothetical protein